MRVHFRSLGRFLVPTLLITALFTFAAAQSSVTILQGADAITMDPHLIQASPEHNILNHVFEGLVYRDDSMTIPAAPGDLVADSRPAHLGVSTAPGSRLPQW